MSQKGYSLILSRAAILFEKRHLLLLILIGLLFTIGAIVGIKRVFDEHSPLVELCRKDLASSGFTSPAGYSGYTCGGETTYLPLKYQSTFFRTPNSIRVRFTDGVNLLDCEMERRGSEWVVTGRGSTMASMCP